MALTSLENFQVQNVQQPNNYHYHSSYRRPFEPKEEDLEEDEEEILSRAQEKVRKVKKRKAAVAAKKLAEEEVAKKAIEEARKWKEEAEWDLKERRRPHPVVNGAPPQEKVRRPHGGRWWRFEGKKGKAGPRRRLLVKTPTMATTGMTTKNELPANSAGPCHDAKVHCSHSNRPPIVKKEAVSNPTGEWLAVLESQMAQLLADNRVFPKGQVRIKKLEWLMRDAARRREESPLEPIAGPLVLPKKRRQMVDSEEEREKEGEDKDGEGEEPALKKAEKGKEREE
ncbi:hypothetical protein F5879DRAFT_1047074 [Lentinula edodes]|nr:hypothetical protein F5879DRAFT_1047074 [Lentinula edodes]